MKKTLTQTRRSFLHKSALTTAGLFFLPQIVSSASMLDLKSTTPINGHLWLYASKFPPNWDAYPDLEAVFSDMSYAGLDGVELMESILRHDDAVSKLNDYKNKYNIVVSGSSYGVGMHMWDSRQHQKIVNDLELVIPRLAEVGGKTFGVSVGEADHIKTEWELDAQAETLKVLIRICEDHGIVPNLHNHTYEIENDLHDLKGTLARIPDLKLGPDINWLIRGGIDPVDFIKTYGKQIVYIHLRDQYENGEWTEYLGQGTTDFVGIAEALRKQGFDGEAGIELAFPGDFSPTIPLKDNWKVSRKFVKKTFGW